MCIFLPIAPKNYSFWDEYSFSFSQERLNVKSREGGRKIKISLTEKPPIEQKASSVFSINIEL